MDKRREILFKNIVFLNENRIAMNKNELHIMDRLTRIGIEGIEKENQFNIVAELAANIRKKNDEFRLNNKVHRSVVCRYCGKQVRWMPTKRGKTACIDAEPYKGEVVYSRDIHNYHFDTCSGKKQNN